ncbi:12308_t:CDS:2 [Dentiscutata erythropus]|uniref:12308_t:CDS:1 n=1 Tax=Dentiscutata erythropus TaxID=1348616 RepID=A0A9N9GGF1_9GLOM|nr:12308_t:CDS:2 [Dentiscutata erythropus]
MLTPHHGYSLYYNISGLYDVGKSTLVHEAAKEVGCGVIYVDVPTNVEKFGDEFAKALNISFDKPISLTLALLRNICGIPLKSDLFENLWKPAVIIYDNVDRLALKNPNLLDVLQDDADVSEYIPLFVTSEGTVRRMRGRSSWYRAALTFEIGDMTKDESMDYLVNKSEIPLREAEQFYNLLGGRIEHLTIAVDLFKNTPSFEEAGINPGGHYHNIAKKIVKILLEKGKIKYFDYYAIVNDRKVADFLLATNIFSVRPAKLDINFNSKLIESIIREKIVSLY